jgi:hypothetical protein
MSGRTIATAALVAFLDASSNAQTTRSFQNVDLVDLDVVVTDGEGRPVTGLNKEDFEIREDGKPVGLQTFLARIATDADDEESGRSMVILLDDVTMPRESVNAVKAIATYLAVQARPADDLSVIRFRNLDDEPFGDRRTALARIAEYEGAIVRYAPAGSPEDVLKLITKVSRNLESTGRRRTILVCGDHLQRHSAEPLHRRFVPPGLDRCGGRGRARESQHLRVAGAACTRVRRRDRRGHRRDRVSGGQRLPARARSDLAGRRPLLPARLLAAGLVEGGALDQREGGAQGRPGACATSARQLRSAA